MTQLNKTQQLLMWDLLFETFPAPGGSGSGGSVGYLGVYPSPLRLRDAGARVLAAAPSPKGYTPPLQQREAHSHI